MKVKINKPVAIGGAIHHKVGGIVEVSDKHGAILTKDGWAEKVDPKTPVTPGASTTAPKEAVNPAQAAEVKTDAESTSESEQKQQQS